jgi:hypothetical protein
MRILERPEFLHRPLAEMRRDLMLEQLPIPLCSAGRHGAAGFPLVDAAAK